MGLLWLGCCRAGQEFYTINGESLSTDFCLTVSCIYYQHKRADHHLGVSLARLYIRIWNREIKFAKVGLNTARDFKSNFNRECVSGSDKLV